MGNLCLFFPTKNHSNMQAAVVVRTMGNGSRKRTRAIKATATIVSLMVSSATTTTASAMTTPTANNNNNKNSRNSSSNNSKKRQKRSPTVAITPDNTLAATSKTVARTESFSPLWSGTLQSLTSNVPTIHVEPHTLILGTHPSIKSLEQQQYYGHPMNAFWWIAGDCLGFCRQSVTSPVTGKPYAFYTSLRYDNIVSYDQQVQTLVAKGFAMWDVVQSCQRKGSLDQDIKEEIPNDIRGFCQDHPSIERIVLANGGTGSNLFVKHWKDWFDDPEFLFVPLQGHEASEKAFKYATKSHATKNNNNNNCRRIELISAISVSPAAAKYSYEQKRDFWEKYVYQPGLAAFEKMRG